MKITIIGTAHPLRGGLAAFNERIAEELMAQGHEVTIYSFSLQYPNFLFPGKTQYTDEPAPENLQIHSVINSVNPINWWRVGNRVRKESPDLVLIKFWLPFFGPCFGTILRQISKNKHTKIISILDNVIPHEHRIGDKAFTKYFIKPVDGFVAMSREVLQDLYTFTRSKPAIFKPHPIYDIYGETLNTLAARKHLGLDPNRKYILFFGFIRKYKGLDILIEAMKDARILASDIDLLIAGEYYGEEAYYKELIEQHPIKDRIHTYTEFIPNEAVKTYFSAADVVVQPYRTATQSGISQIAYHFNKPMIVTNVGGLPEIVPDGKVGYVAAVNSEAIADAIMKIYEGNHLANFIEGVQEEKRQYEWEHFTASILDMKEKM